jgi:hypothetical protein
MRMRTCVKLKILYSMSMHPYTCMHGEYVASVLLPLLLISKQERTGVPSSMGDREAARPLVKSYTYT